jgi:DNA-binding transcriptional ArsR family regulator
MAIRFELAAGDEEALAFATSPLFEAMLSLHVLSEPRHHALQHGWVRAARLFNPVLRREIAALSFLYRWTLPNCILPAPDAGDETFADEVARLRRLRSDVAAFELLRPLYDHGGAARPARRRVLADPAVQATAKRRAGALGRPSRAAAELLFDDPAALRDRLAALLEAYWEEAFAAEWARIEPPLADAIVSAGRQIAVDGVYRFLLGLAPQLRVEPAEERFGLDVPHDHTVRLGRQRPLLLVPSVYVWPHVRVNCDAPWPLVLAYRAPHLVESMHGTTPEEFVRALKAVAAPSRLRILELLAVRPRSTQELAPLVALTEAGTSRHLRALAATGLLTSHREGYYVVYALVPDALEALGEELRALSVPRSKAPDSSY